MKICVLTHTFPRFKGDPVAPFMDNFCEGLVEAGNEVLLVTPFDQKFKISDYPNYKVYLFRYIYPDSFHLLGYSRTLEGDQKLRWFVYLLSPFMFFFELLTLVKLVRREKIDIISAHWIVPNGFVAAVTSILTNVPVVITVPGSDMYLAKKNIFFRSMAKFAVNRASVVVSNSVRYLEEFSKFGVDLSHSKEVIYGVDVAKYKPSGAKRKSLRHKFNIPERAKVILAVGRMVEKKGFAYLVEAMPDVIEHNKDAKLVLVGGGDQQVALEELVRSLQIEKHVIFLGRIDYIELANIYSMADVYVAPSIEDSKGNLESHTVALFEAISSGLPVVATELAVGSKYVVGGKNGYRVKQRDAAALADKIKSVLASDMSKMGEASRQIAQRYLSYKKSGKMYSEIFRDVVLSSR
ncbi:MAG: glycosyltransferase [bacterium]|nr:glycosyltransferase [bacterium]